MMKRNYWLTLHWPPEIGEEVDYGVYLLDGKEDVGDGLGKGDLVWLYETKDGPRIVGKPRRREGEGGIVALIRITSGLRSSRRTPETYTNGKKRWWRWKASGKCFERAGFVPRQKLNDILGYNHEYTFHGFGKKRSGLLDIRLEEHRRIYKTFRQK